MAFTNDKPLSLVLSLRIQDRISFSFPSLILSLTKNPSNTRSKTSHPSLNRNLFDEHSSDSRDIASVSDHTSHSSMIDIETSILVSAKQLERAERRKHRSELQREIINIAKKSIKSSYQKRYITKDEYKIIMKKVVTKAIYSNRIDPVWIDKSINSYVKKYRMKMLIIVVFVILIGFDSFQHGRLIRRYALYGRGWSDSPNAGRRNTNPMPALIN